MEVIVFKGMTIGFLPGDLSIGFDDKGQPNMQAIPSTSFNVLPLWLRVAHENVTLSKAAFEAIATEWNDDPEKQRKLLLAELSPSIQVPIACGIALDALYEQTRPHANISEKDISAWKKNKTNRSAQIFEVVRRVYRLNGKNSKAIKEVTCSPEMSSI